MILCKLNKYPPPLPVYFKFIVDLFFFLEQNAGTHLLSTFFPEAVTLKRKPTLCLALPEAGGPRPFHFGGRMV